MSQDPTTEIQIQPLSTDCVRILHVTDSHIFADEEGKLLGLSTRVSFDAVMSRVKKEEFCPDFLLATGDLSQDASVASYQFIQNRLGVLQYPSFWIPGNHDVPGTMDKILIGQSVHREKVIVTPDWLIVMLDSSVPKKVHGHLASDQIDLVTKSLNQYPDKHVVVVMHHQPVDVGCNWLDNLGIKNPEVLFKAVSSHKKRVCFLWGHVHQEFDSVQNDIRLLATPSTCVQFAPKSKEFAAGQEGPGYRYLTLNKDGSIETVVHRVEDIEYTVDYSIKGY